MEIVNLIEIVKIALSLGFLIAASFFDYKARYIPDKLLIVFSVVAFLTTSADILFLPDFSARIVTLLINVGISAGIFYGIYYLGLYGGADAILLMILSIIIPWPPSNQIFEVMFAPNLPIFTISVFDNAILFSTMIAPYALISNLIWKRRTGKSLFENLQKEPLIKKIVALLFCIKTEKSKIKPFDMIAEESGKITLKKVQEEDLTKEEIDRAPENVFIVFSIPMVIFITIGLFVSIFLVT